MHIREILLPQSMHAAFKTELTGRLTQLQRMNLIVGPNNSGKSRLLRSLVPALRQQKYVAANPTSCQLTDRRDSLLAKWKEFDQVGRDAEDRILHLPIPTTLDRELHRAAAAVAEDFKRREAKNSGGTRELISFMLEVKDYFDLLGHYSQDERNFGSERPQIIYIPTIRGFRAVTAGHYRKLAEDDYFTNEKPDEVFTGDTMNGELRQRLLGKRSDREIIRRFETFLGDHFFEGQPITLIPKDDRNRVEIKLGSEADLDVAHLGDGLQHIILILFPVFIRQQPTILLLEEPELFLHPGLQTRLLDAFQDTRFNHVQLLATTHSNHLINLAVDREKVAIFRIRKSVDQTDGQDEGNAIHSVSVLDGEDRSILSDLGVQKASVLLTNCVLFVEGPTDRLYYQRFLDLYTAANNLRRFLPDLHSPLRRFRTSSMSLTSWSHSADSSSLRFDQSGDRNRVILTLQNPGH